MRLRSICSIESRMPYGTMKDKRNLRIHSIESNLSREKSCFARSAEHALI